MPERLADCTTGRLKAGRADIVTAVHGTGMNRHDHRRSTCWNCNLAQIDCAEQPPCSTGRAAGKTRC